MFRVLTIPPYTSCLHNRPRRFYDAYLFSVTIAENRMVIIRPMRATLRAGEGSSGGPRHSRDHRTRKRRATQSTIQMATAANEAIATFMSRNLDRNRLTVYHRPTQKVNAPTTANMSSGPRSFDDTNATEPTKLFTRRRSAVTSEGRRLG